MARNMVGRHAMSSKSGSGGSSCSERVTMTMILTCKGFMHNSQRERERLITAAGGLGMHQW